MKITFDPEADAMYIYFNEDSSARTEELDEGETMVDFNNEGEIIGIELLNVSHRFPLGFLGELKTKKKFVSAPIEILGKRSAPRIVRH